MFTCRQVRRPYPPASTRPDMGGCIWLRVSIEQPHLGIAVCAPVRAARNPVRFLSTIAVHNLHRLSTGLTGARAGPKRWAFLPVHIARRHIIPPTSRMQNCCHAGARTRCPQPGALIHNRSCGLPQRRNRRLAASCRARPYAGMGAVTTAVSGGVIVTGRAHVNALRSARAVHKRGQLSTGRGKARAGRIDAAWR